jgi:hypothetical protein
MTRHAAKDQQKMGRPALSDTDCLHVRTSDGFSSGQILRDPLAALEIVLVDHLAKRRRVPVFGVQVHVRRHPAQRKAGWQHAGGAYLLKYAPGIEMLHGPLLEPLPLRDAMLLRAPLDDRARNSALRELNCHRHSDRATADNHNSLILSCGSHVCLLRPHQGSLALAPPRSLCCRDRRGSAAGRRGRVLRMSFDTRTGRPWKF